MYKYETRLLLLWSSVESSDQNSDAVFIRVTLREYQRHLCQICGRSASKL